MLDLAKPFVSICIPVFNGENYLSNCIESILDQDYDNFEILIIDNCSIDSTASIISSWPLRKESNPKNFFKINLFCKKMHSLNYKSTYELLNLLYLN